VSYTVKLLPLSKIEIKDATDWYNSRESGLGKEFISELK